MEIYKYVSDGGNLFFYCIVGIGFTIKAIVSVIKATKRRKLSITEENPFPLYESDYLWCWTWVCFVFSYWGCAFDGNFGLLGGGVVSLLICGFVYRFKTTILAHIIMSFLAIVVAGFASALCASI